MNGLDEQATDSARDASEAAQAAEVEDALSRAIESLPIEQRAAVIMVSLEGMSYAEAASVQRCSLGTLAWRLAQAKARLAQRLAPFLNSHGGHNHAM